MFVFFCVFWLILREEWVECSPPPQIITKRLVPRSVAELRRCYDMEQMLHDSLLDLESDSDVLDYYAGTVTLFKEIVVKRELGPENQKEKIKVIWRMFFCCFRVSYVFSFFDGFFVFFVFFLFFA